jgi:hypothetical protein
MNSRTHGVQARETIPFPPDKASRNKPPKQPKNPSRPSQAKILSVFIMQGIHNKSFASKNGFFAVFGEKEEFKCGGIERTQPRGTGIVSFKNRSAVVYYGQM